MSDTPTSSDSAAVAAPECETATPTVPPSHRPTVAVTEAAYRLKVIATFAHLLREGMTPRAAAHQLGEPRCTIWRWAQRLGDLDFGDPAQREACIAALIRHNYNSGRRPKIALTPDETTQLRSLFLRTNRAEDAGSMRTAAKFFALDPNTRDELRTWILSALDAGRVPRALVKLFNGVTPTHFAAHRRPRMAATENFCGTVGAFTRDIVDRQRIIESDDGTLNFACCIPWPLGGDPCSDKYGWRVGRWQILPAMEAGWSRMYLGYALVARPRGSYRAEDIRSLIHLVLENHGQPDKFRFERGSWESDQVVNLIKSLGIELDTVYQSNQKPFIEGGFSKLWTYLSTIDGQLGRYRGEMQEENRIMQAVRAGRADPLQHFPKLADVIRALDGAMAMHNSDTVSGVYGKWVPEVRHRELALARPWTPLPEQLRYLFAPYCREWTVAKGTVGGKISLMEDAPALPFYFAADDLWRLNGHRVRIYFDPAAEHCIATVVAIHDFAGYRANQIICTADLIGDLPHFARASMGWSDQSTAPESTWRKTALSALRRDLRSLDVGGRVTSSTSEIRDGRGNTVTLRTDSRADTAPATTQSPQRITFDSDSATSCGSTPRTQDRRLADAGLGTVAPKSQRGQSTRPGSFDHVRSTGLELDSPSRPVSLLSRASDRSRAVPTSSDRPTVAPSHRRTVPKSGYTVSMSDLEEL